MYQNTKIRSLTLVNFQIFSNRKIEFDKGMNVIIGENNSGKSSLMRAVYWTETNKPSGEWMCRDGSDGEPLVASACIEYTDGVKITRVRGPKVNKYLFFDGTVEHSFEKFGRTGIPTPIQEYLGKTKLSINTDIVPGIAMQDEQPFMVFESGPTKGSLINYLTGVDVADKIKKDLSSEVRAYNKQVTNDEARIEDIEAELQDYNDLDSQLKKLEAVEAKEELNTRHRASIRMLDDYDGLVKLSVIKNLRIQELETIMAAFSNLPNQAKQLEAQERCLELARRCLRHKPVLGAIAKLEKGLERIQIPMLKADEDHEHACTLRDLAREREELVARIVDVTDHIDRVSAKLLKFEGQQCPLCKGVIHV